MYGHTNHSALPDDRADWPYEKHQLTLGLHFLHELWHNIIIRVVSDSVIFGYNMVIKSLQIARLINPYDHTW